MGKKSKIPSDLSVCPSTIIPLHPSFGSGPFISEREKKRSQSFFSKFIYVDFIGTPI